MSQQVVWVQTIFSAVSNEPQITGLDLALEPGYVGKDLGLPDYQVW